MMTMSSNENKVKVVSVRLEEDILNDADFVSRIDGMPVSEMMRQAITEYLHTRRNDPEFADRLRKTIEHDKKILERLTSGATG